MRWRPASISECKPWWALRLTIVPGALSRLTAREKSITPEAMTTATMTLAIGTIAIIICG